MISGIKPPFNASAQREFETGETRVRETSVQSIGAFNERRCLGEVTILPVDQLLELILNEIQTQIVPEFERFVKKP
jgi:hypothetical protein